MFTVKKKKKNGKIQLAAMHIIAFRELISPDRANNEDVHRSIVKRDRRGMTCCRVDMSGGQLCAFANSFQVRLRRKHSTHVML